MSLTVAKVRKVSLPVPGTKKTAELTVIAALDSPYGIVQDWISDDILDRGRFFEEHEVAEILGDLSPGDLFVDVGANIGSFTAAARAVGAETVSVEPQPLLQKTLRKNAGKGEVVAAACGTSKEPLEIWESYMRHPMRGTIMANVGAASLSSRVGRRDSGETAPVRTLDDIVGKRSPKVIKVDVEEMEADVLLSGMEVIKRCQPILYLEQNHGANLAQCYNILAPLGYRVSRVIGTEKTSTTVRYAC